MNKKTFCLHPSIEFRRFFGIKWVFAMHQTVEHSQWLQIRAFSTVVACRIVTEHSYYLSRVEFCLVLFVARWLELIDG